MCCKNLFNSITLGVWAGGPMFTIKHNWIDTFFLRIISSIFFICLFGVSWSQTWDCECNYRKEITIDNSSSSTALNDYQVSLTVTYETGMEADFSDLRFETSDNVVLDHWIEYKNDGNSAFVWIKVPGIGASSVETIFMYYGGCSGTQSSPSDVFVFYEDFETFSGWSDLGSGTLVQNTSAFSYAVGEKTSNNDSNGGYKLIGTTINNFRLITREYRPGSGSGGARNRYGVENSTNGYTVNRNAKTGGNGDFGYESRTNGSAGNRNYSTISQPQNNWYRSELRYCSASGEIEAELYGDNRATVAGSLITGTMPSGSIYNSFDRVTIRGGYNYYVDFMALTHYVCDEPVVSIGVEENLSLDASFTSNASQVLTGNSIQFTDQSIGSINSWNWTFEGGNPASSTDQNPIVQYNSAGNYDVSLSVTDNNGCSITENIADFINVVDNFTYCNAQGINSGAQTEWISLVEVGSYSHASGASGYSDFTSETIALEKNANNNITLTPSFSGSATEEQWRLWIDLNNDGDFLDSGEELFNGTSSVAISGNISIPDITLNTKMRIAMKRSLPNDLTRPGGNVTANAVNSPNGEEIDKLVDDIVNSSGLSKYLTRSTTGWMQYQFDNGEKYVVTKYSLTSANDYEGRDPRNWNLQGSNDGASWINLDTRTNESFSSRWQKREFSFSNSVAYEYYRLDVTANNGEPLLQIGEWELFESNIAPGPCEEFSYGEVEDYSVEIKSPCSEPDIPTVTIVGSNPACKGESVSLNISGNLNDASQWSIYTGSCGGTLVGTTTGSVYDLGVLNSTETYYVRGDGGCTGTTCAEITVTVNDPSCSITGTSSVCPLETNITYNSVPGMATYNWTVANGDATIDPPGDTESISVDVGSKNFTLELTISDAQGCSKTCSYSVNVNGPVGLEADTTILDCPESNNGSIDLKVPYPVQFNPEYADIGSTLLSNRDEFTLEGWIKVDLATVGSRISLFGQNDAIEFGFSNSNTLMCWTASGGSVSTNSYPSDNSWHHVATVGDGSSIVLYIDGTQVATGGSSTSNYGNNTGFTTKIGYGVWDPTGGTFPGQMIKVGIWSTALSASEIDNLAAGFTNYQGSESGLLAGYNFYEGNGTNLSSVISGTDGTFSGTPSWIDDYTYAWTQTGNAGFSASTQDLSSLSPGTYNVLVTNSSFSCPTITGSWEINFSDKTAPLPDVTNLPAITDECEVTGLVAPTATDNCAGSITGTHNAVLPILASTTITWTYDDGNGNTSTQTQSVIIDDVTAPVADVTNLPDITDECEVASLTTPMATDNCAGAITGTHDIVLPITVSTTITWTYDDGNGNTSTQTQNVVINNEEIDINVEAVANDCQTGETGTSTITWNITKLAGTDDWTYDFSISNGSTVVDSGTNENANGNIQISYTTNNTSGIDQTFTLTISNVTDNCGSAEVNETNNISTTVLFGVPNTGNIIAND